MKSRRLTTQIVAGVVVVVFAAGILLDGGSLHASWLRYYSLAVLVATGVLWLWDSILWKTALAQRVRSVPLNLEGTWKGTLASAWVNPATGNQIEPKTAYLVVRQSASNISVVLLTDESRSKSTFAQVSTLDGIASLDYIYLNRPDNKVEHRSRMHHGSTALDISGRPARRLRGRYWTDRDTRGELDFVSRHSTKADDYDEAVALFT